MNKETNNNKDKEDTLEDSRVDSFIQDQLTKAECSVDNANWLYMNALHFIYAGILKGSFRVHSGEDAMESFDDSYKSLQIMYVTLDVKDNGTNKTKDVLRATMSVRGEDDTIFFSIHKIANCVGEHAECKRKFRHEISAPRLVGKFETERTLLIRRLYNLMERVCETEEEVLSGLVAKKAYEDILNIPFGKSMGTETTNNNQEQ